MKKIQINAEKVEIALGNNNLIIWASDWSAITDAARVGHPHLRREFGGNATYGAISYFFIPWQDTPAGMMAMFD